MAIKRYADLIIATSGVTLSLICLIRLAHLSYLEKKVRGFFFAIFGMVNGYSMCILVRELIRGETGPGFAAVSRVAFFFQALLSSLLAVMVIGFLLYQSGEKDYFRSPVFRAAVFLWLIYFILQIYTQFTGSLYSVDHLNRYARGPHFRMQMIPPILIMLLNLVTLWRRRGNLSRNQRIAFSCYALIPLSGMLIQSVFFGVNLIALGTVVAALILYNQIVTDQKERFIRNMEENARLKMDVLLAQIQPHFLFNSLTTIQFLCRKDPEKAAEAVGNFTDYLRHNMDSLTIDKPIPFREELRHVQSYLALQKIRFGEELQIRYDLPYMDFSLPTLTVQPLVENAVCYGIRRNEDSSGTVTLASRRCGNVVELTVSDDGPGFERENRVEDPSKSHTGIRNVRERIRRISGGDLVIESAPGRGTRAVLRIPLSPDQP
ncbi:MAG: histidine kinase [Clostridia bacterium]|nr:histidine kinase [Clostridia bacterium]